MGRSWLLCGACENRDLFNTSLFTNSRIQSGIYLFFVSFFFSVFFPLWVKRKERRHRRMSLLARLEICFTKLLFGGFFWTALTSEPCVACSLGNARPLPCLDNERLAATTVLSEACPFRDAQEGFGSRLFCFVFIASFMHYCLFVSVYLRWMDLHSARWTHRSCCCYPTQTRPI